MSAASQGRRGPPEIVLHSPISPRPLAAAIGRAVADGLISARGRGASLDQAITASLENALGDASNFVTVVPATKNSPLVVVVVLRTADDRTPAPTNVAVSRQRLTARELQVSSLLKSGATNAEIAKELGISYHTARHHVQHVLDKLGVRSRTALRQSTSDPPSQCA